MPKFILIDQSLLDVGGHHFEYALQVLTAAERAGFESHLAANRDFRPTAEVPSHWRVRCCYRHRTYSQFSFTAELEAPQPPSLLRRPLDCWLKRRGRERRATSFARDTAAFFQDNPLSAGDQVFIATLSEIELLGLGNFFQRCPTQPRVDWHVQFHLPIYTGCEPDYPAQEKKLRRLRRVVRRAAALAAGHRLHCYTTTEPLTVQYDRLGAAPFHTLPYPVNPTLRPSGKPAARPRRGPLRVSFLGGVRYEKGYQLLPRIIDRLWHEYVGPGRICFQAQSDFDFSLPAAPENLELVETRAALGRLPTDAITLFDEPLDSQSYCRLTAGSDIGLLPYDRQRYHARCSGVMVEFLAAGVPVVVPAGCWMADQLAEPNRQYHMSLRNGRQALERVTLRRNAAAEIPGEAVAVALLLRWPVGTQLCAGAYARVEATFFASDGSPLDCRPAIVGPARPDHLGTALVRVPAEAATLKIDWRNAYGPQELDFSEVELCFVAEEADRPLPLGAVGLAAVDADHLPDALAEMIDHYPHYRRTAAAFASQWGAWYSPTQVVRELLAQASPAARHGSQKPHLRISPPLTTEVTAAQ